MIDSKKLLAVRKEVLDIKTYTFTLGLFVFMIALNSLAFVEQYLNTEDPSPNPLKGLVCLAGALYIAREVYLIRKRTKELVKILRENS